MTEMKNNQAGTLQKAVANTKKTNAVAEAQKMNFSAVIKSANVQKSLAETLGDATRTKTFTSSLISSVSTNIALRECEPLSIISAALLGESLNLSPSPQLGHYYMVPFKDNKMGVTKATFQLGYKGYIQLAMRSGQYRKINVVPVKEGELLEWNKFTEEIKVKPLLDPAEEERAKTIGYYCMIELTNGFKKEMYWTKEKMEAHALKYSKGYAAKKGYTFWEKDFDGMAKKTMLRQIISKWGIMSIEMQNAFKEDMTIQDMSEDSEPIYFDADVIDVETGEIE